MRHFSRSKYNKNYFLRIYNAPSVISTTKNAPEHFSTNLITHEYHFFTLPDFLITFYALSIFYIFAILATILDNTILPIYLRTNAIYDIFYFR